MAGKFVTTQGEVTISDPPLAHTLFSTTKFAWLFLLVRLFLGYEWIQAGLHKMAQTATCCATSVSPGLRGRCELRPSRRPPRSQLQPHERSLTLDCSIAMTARVAFPWPSLLLLRGCYA
jgi:hypothetical protein